MEPSDATPKNLAERFPTEIAYHPRALSDAEIRARALQISVDCWPGVHSKSAIDETLERAKRFARYIKTGE